jgi:hypothetical protein
MDQNMQFTTTTTTTKNSINININPNDVIKQLESFSNLDTYGKIILDKTFVENQILPFFYSTSDHCIKERIINIIKNSKKDENFISIICRMVQHLKEDETDLIETLASALFALGHDQHLAVDTLVKLCERGSRSAVKALKWNTIWVICCNNYRGISSDSMSYRNVTVDQIVKCDHFLKSKIAKSNSIEDKKEHDTFIFDLHRRVPEGQFKQELRNQLVLPQFRQPTIDISECTVVEHYLCGRSMGDMYHNIFKANQSHKDKTCECFCNCPKHVNQICSSANE